MRHPTSGELLELHFGEPQGELTASVLIDGSPEFRFGALDPYATSAVLIALPGS